MLSAFANALRTPDLRRKILFTLAILAVFRIGDARLPMRFTRWRQTIAEPG